MAPLDPLSVDTAQLAGAGGRLLAAAGALPQPPTPFSPAGADALSMGIAGQVARVVGPVVAALPVSKEEMSRYAQAVLDAAGVYDRTDRQLAEEILQRMYGIPDPASGAPGGGAPAAGVAGGATAAPGEAGMAASPAAGAGQQAGQLGQMMGMPMQMAAQAAQIPMQIAGMAAAIPQGIMQGVQSAMQHVGQMSGIGDKGEQNAQNEAREQAELAQQKPEEEPRDRPAEPRKPTEAAGPARESAAPGTSSGERVPVPDHAEARPDVPKAPRPAPTRPAISPETML
jgi:hypothetical protein